MEVTTEKFILTAHHNAYSLDITVFELNKECYVGKYATKLDTRKGSIFSSFGQTKTLLEFLQSPLNFNLCFKQKTLTLRWKIVTEFFSKEFQYIAKLEQQQLTEKEILEHQIVSLRNKIALCEQFKKRGIQSTVLDKTPQHNTKDHANKISENSNSMDESQMPYLNKKKESRRANKDKTNNQQQEPARKKRNTKKCKLTTPRLEKKNENIERIKIAQENANEKGDRQNQENLEMQNKSQKKTTQDIQEIAVDNRMVDVANSNGFDTPVKTKVCNLGEATATPNSKSNTQFDPQFQIQPNFDFSFGNVKATYQLEGKVRLEFENGDYYEGETKDNLYDGYGIYYSVVNGIYKGQWKKGKGCGYGISVDNEGNRHEGIYDNDLKNGHGTQVFANGEKYVGNFKNSERDGHGIYYFSDGGTYEGEWKQDLQDGHGKYTSPNGTVYEGSWRRDEKDGQGVLYNSFGKVQQVWKMGTLVYPEVVKLEEPVQE